MKKVLFATTALVASAGFAAADVSLSGSAEMGIVGADGLDTQFHHDLDVTFKMSGETDTGLTFGATIDLDEVGDDCSSNTGFVVNTYTPSATISSTGVVFAFPTGSPTTTAIVAVETGSVCVGGDGISENGGEHSVWVKGSFGNLTLGDTDGALDWAMTEAVIGGDINDTHEHAGFNGNSGLDGSSQVLRYDYSAGDFAFALSLELEDETGGDETIGVGFKYSAGMFGVGLGFQSGDASSEAWGISVDANFDNGFRAIVNFSETNDVTHWGLALGYTMDALTLGLNLGEFEGGDTEGSISAVYDLGGGAAIQASYATSKGGVGDDAFAIGLSMKF